MHSWIGMIPVKTTYLFEPGTGWLSHSQSRYEDVFALDFKVSRCARTEFLRNVLHLVIGNIPSVMQQVAAVRY